MPLPAADRTPETNPLTPTPARTRRGAWKGPGTEPDRHEEPPTVRAPRIATASPGDDPDDKARRR